MKLNHLLLFPFVLLTALSASAVTPQVTDPKLLSKLSLPSKQWKISSSASGDLNGDGITDLAIIIMKNVSESEEAVLKIYFQDQTGKLNEILSSNQAVCRGCGGMKGGDEPYSLNIRNGIFTLEFFGGSREVVTSKSKWRYHDHDFDWTGSTVDQEDTLASEKGELRKINRDANLLTSKMIEKLFKIKQKPIDDSEDPKLLIKIANCSVDRKYQEIKLSKFKYDQETPYCTSAILD